MFDATRPLGVVVLWVCVGGFSVEGTPGPVPIPVAKLDCADGTAIVGLWESKTPPTHQKLNKEKIVGGKRGVLLLFSNNAPRFFYIPQGQHD